MRVIDYSLLEKRTWSKDTLNYVALIHEYKGRQQLYLRQKPEVLDKLVVVSLYIHELKLHNLRYLYSMFFSLVMNNQ